MSRRVRRGVTRASWNAQHADMYISHLGALAALIGLVCQSWLVFMVAVFILSLLMQYRVTRVLILALMCTPWILLASAAGVSLAGVPGGIVMAFLGGGAAYVALEAGNEYYRDVN